MKIPFFVFITITYIILVSAVYYLYRSNQQAITAAAVAKAVPTPVEKVVSLPLGAVKISECIPTEGEHWVRPADLPGGPYYTAYNGKVVALEYMLKLEDLPGEKTAKMSLPQIETYMKQNKYDLNDFVVHNDKHFELTPAEYKNFSLHWSPPHSGFPEPHIDLHIFLADHHELEQICPDAKLEEVYSPEVIKNIQENNIPFPEAPKQ